MIELLKKIENTQILDILSLDNHHFKTLDVDYHPPRVERIQYLLPDNKRLSFHVLHPCKPEEALYHPHPWSSAMHVLQGKYEMGLSYSENPQDLDDTETGVHNASRLQEQLLKLEVNSGMYYEMSYYKAWHYVRPIDEPCYTVMLTGDLFFKDKKGNKAPQALNPLTDDRINEIKQFFYIKYLNFSNSK